MTLANWSTWLVAGIAGIVALAPTGVRAATQPETVPGQIVVGFRTPAVVDAAAAEASRGIGQVLGSQRRLGAARMKLRSGVSIQAAMDRLSRRSDVAYVEPLYIRRTAATPNDPAYSSQWALSRIDAHLAWSSWQPQSQVMIAIVDTGVDLTHPDLVNVLARDAQGAVLNYNSLTNSSAAGAANDDNGHGTHCAGIAAGQINNARGIAGVAGWNPSVPDSNRYVKLLPVKVLDGGGAGTDADVAEGIIWAADQGARVISLSLGGAGSSNTLSNATSYARSRGCVVVAAAGNEGVSTRFYPAANTGVISVAATDPSDTLADFSNWGSWVKVAAPGVSISSTYPGGRYVSMSGTSMATPHVAGEAAAILAQNPGLKNTAVENLILDHVEAYGARDGKVLGSAAGRINVHSALDAAGGGAVSVSALTLSPSSVTGGTAATATVTLTGTAPTGGVAVSLASDAGYATTPTTLQVPAGQLTAAFQVMTSPVATVSSATISAAVGADVRTAMLQIIPPTLSSLTLSPTAVDGGATSTGTVTLSGAAPAGGVLVALSSGSAAASVPSTVSVSGGASSASFTISTRSVSVDTAAVLSATFAGVTRSASLTIRRSSAVITLASVSVSPLQVAAGASATGTVVLSGPAPAGGAIVTLSASGPASTPANVTVAAGATSAAFVVSTVPVSAASTATISALYSGVTRSASLTVQPQEAGFRLALSSGRVLGGKSVTGSIFLDGPAAQGGVTFGLSSSSSAVTLPSSVTARAGARKVSFTIRTAAVARQELVEIQATSALGTTTAQLTIEPPSIRKIRLRSSRVRGGQSTSAVVYLRGAAPAGGLYLSVSSDQRAVEVPRTVYVPAGGTRTRFAIQTSAVATPTVAGISVKLQDDPGNAQLTVVPAKAAQSKRTRSRPLRQAIRRGK